MFDSLLKAVVGVVVTPASLAADIVTLGGTLSDRDEPYTVEALKDILKNLENATKPD
jgi:hypothetical protein